ncbi:MAG: hypothetical protein KTR15_03145 [Phycisphaeraceae bacterium]|nr:hypothetical protein [Phycisphaeraceae bacterium]
MTFFLYVVVGLVVGFYLILPLWVFFLMGSLRLKETITQIDASQLDANDLAFFQEHAAALAPFGFEPLGYLRVEKSIGKATVDLLCTVNNQSATLSIATISMHAPGKTKAKQRLQHFVTELSNGVAVGVGTASSKPTVIRPAKSAGLSIYEETNAAALYRYHEAWVTEHQGKETRIPPRTDQSLVEMQYESTRKTMDAFAETPFWKKLDEDLYRINLPGIYLETWSLFPPIIWVLRWYRRAQSQAFIKRSGIKK